LSRGQPETDLSDEIRGHLEERVAELISRGVSQEEAIRQARRDFGNVVLIEEQAREVWRWRWIEGLLSDTRFALRQIRKEPAFAAAAALTLALGIGGTTAIFTLLNQVMLQSLPVVNPQQLWRIGDAATCCYADGYSQSSAGVQNDWSLFSWETYTDFRANTPAFEELAAFQIGEGNAELAMRRAGAAGPLEPRNGEYVSGNFFQTLGVSGWRGRMFTDADDRAGAPPVAVMSFHTWQDREGSDPSVVGSTYEINGHAFTIVGIAPPGFFGAKTAASDMPDIWLPLATEPLIAGRTSRLKNPGVAWLDLLGRVRPGTNPSSLEAQLRVELHGWLASHARDMTARDKALWEKQTLHLTPGGAGVSLMRGSYGDALRLLLVAAVCVLLLACANVANLLLARGLRNRHEVAVRTALGASRAQLLRKSLVDSAVLALLGGATGIWLAYAGARMILRLAFTSPNAWTPLNAHPSPAMLWFALAVSVLAAIVSGTVPAWMTSRAVPLDAMRGTNRIIGYASGTATAQKTLIVGQAAIALVLLSAAAMLGQSLRNLQQQDFGFDRADRYLVSIDPKLSNYPEARLDPLFQQIHDRLVSIPGVRMVSGALYAPLSGSNWSHEVRIAGHPEPGPRDDLSTTWTRVMAGFFETIGDRILAGRALDEDDTAGSRRVAVVNKAFAKKFFGNENPIGQHFGPAPGPNANTYEVVGVAADVRYFAESSPGRERPMYFVPEAQSSDFDNANLENREIWSHYLYNIVIWAPSKPAGLDAQVRRALASVAPDLVVYDVAPYSAIVDRRFSEENMIASLAWLFGALALVLAAVGLYGVTSYGVQQRTREIGVRMALGANRSSIVATVLRGAFLPVAIGLALGVPTAIAVGHAIASWLFGVAPSDPVLVSVAALLLGLGALLATVIPARQAADVDPVETLRAQ
jgi:predicted permease